MEIKKLEQFWGSPYTLASDPVESETSGSSPVYRNLYPNCEVMLSKRGLYPSMGGGILPGKGSGRELDIILLLLFYCDGKRSLSSIFRYLDIPLDDVSVIAFKLEERGLMERITNG